MDPEITAEITQINLYQPPDVSNPVNLIRGHDSTPIFVKSDQPFTLEVFFTVQELISSDQKNDLIKYQIQTSARNCQTGDLSPLADGNLGILNDSRRIYRNLLSIDSLTSGLYCLRIFVLFSRNSIFSCAHQEIPSLKVA